MKGWTVTFYNPSVQKAMARLPKGLLAKYVRLTELMEQYGPDIGMPHTRHMGKGLIEKI